MHSLDIFSVLWVFALAAVFFAAFVRGVTGFGFSLILAPILLLFVDPTSVVVTNLLLALIANIVVIVFSLKKLNLKKLMPVLISSIIGIPFGAWILTAASPSVMKILIGGVTTFFAIVLALGINRPFKQEKLAGGVVGLVGGLLSSSTSLSGPPAVLYMHNQNWPKELIHSSLATYFLFTCFWSLVALYVAGRLDTQILVSAVSLTPALLVGIFLGVVVFRRINNRFFRWLSIAVVVGSGILGILSGLGVLS